MKIKTQTFLLLPAFFLLTAFVEDNSHYIDSLNRELSNAKNETRRLMYEAEIARVMPDKDSAASLLESVLDRAVEMNEMHVVMAANMSLGYIAMGNAQMDDALNHFATYGSLAGEMHDTLNMAQCKRYEGMVYATKYNFKAAESHYRTSEELLEHSSQILNSLPDKKYLGGLASTYHQHALLFAMLESLDSAQLFEKRAIAIFKRIGWNSEMAASLASLAVVHSKQNNHQAAIESLNLSLEACTADDAPTISSGLSLLALEYSAAGNFKAAQQKADSALLIARNINASKEKAGAFQALAAINEKSNDFKQALYYSDSAAVINEKIAADQSTAAVASAQQKFVRQEQKAVATKQRLAQQLKGNIEFIGIAIFVITCMVFAIALGRKKHIHSVAKVLGVIALLLMFELVSLILNPIMEKWTNHSSFYMLLALAAVAAVLVPLHHQIEDLVKKWTHAE